MGNINLTRVVLGGLVAGLVINIFEFVLNTYVYAEQMNDVLSRLGVAEPSTGQIVWFLIIGFLFGILLVWTYAAIRPRFGAAIKTAIIAGVTLWLAGLPALVSQAIIGIWPGDVAIMAGVATLIELAVAAVAGAWLYQET